MCRPYLIHAIEECIKTAVEGGTGREGGREGRWYSFKMPARVVVETMVLITASLHSYSPFAFPLLLLLLLLLSLTRRDCLLP